MSNLAQIQLEPLGPIATHNMPCAVCSVRHAVYLTGRGRFDPCWLCQEDGWCLLRMPRWLRRWF